MIVVQKQGRKIGFFLASIFGLLITSQEGLAETTPSYRQLLQEQKEFFALQDSLKREARSAAVVDSKNLSLETSAEFSAGQSNTLAEAASGPESDLIHAWFAQNQESTPSGLVVSHPDDAAFIYHEGIQEEWAKIYGNTQAYTYDQALAGITLLEHGDLAGAKRIFDYFYRVTQQEGSDFSGFWTVYNVDSGVDWKRYEWRKGQGENAWIAIFALQYWSANPDAMEADKGLQLATVIAKWISTLPHHNGAVAMSPDDPAGTPNFGAVYSVENNLDYYALLKVLSNEGLSPQDRQLFTSEFSALKNWLQTEAYDTSSGLFKRGGQFFAGTGEFQWDTHQSLDVNSWAISAVGISTLIDDFGVVMEDFVTRIQNTFAVQEDGSHGGDIFSAKGFDFSDAVNAALVGRTGIKWVEGTNQMALDYKLLADHYRPTDTVLADHYQSLADYFLGRNAENALGINGALSYTYADAPDVQIFYGTSTWRTFPGQAAPSTAWAYFALNASNPFVIVAPDAPVAIDPIFVSVSTAALGPQNLTIHVAADRVATVQFDSKVLQGMYDELTRTLSLNGPESWFFSFEPGASAGELSLRTFERSFMGLDAWQYVHEYSFTADALLESDAFTQSFGAHLFSETTSYDYLTGGGALRLGSTASTTFSDGQYAYGQETTYAYDLDAEGALTTTRMTVTQETRNTAFLRTLVSYQLVIHQNGTVEYLPLSTTVLPL